MEITNRSGLDTGSNEERHCKPLTCCIGSKVKHRFDKNWLLFTDTRRFKIYKNLSRVIIFSSDEKRAKGFSPFHLLFPRSFLFFFFFLYHPVKNTAVNRCLHRRIVPFSRCHRPNKKIQEKFSTRLDRKIIHRFEDKTTMAPYSQTPLNKLERKTNEFNWIFFTEYRVQS